jgi:hypothetical protein
LQPTPEQWDQIPTMAERKVDKKNNSIEVTLRYKEYDFDSKVTVSAKDDGVIIRVTLDKALPEKLVGKAGFNLEFLPSVYFEKTYLIDGRPGNFPLYPSSNMEVRPVLGKNSSIRVVANSRNRNRRGNCGSAVLLWRCVDRGHLITRRALAVRLSGIRPCISLTNSRRRAGALKLF